MKVHKIVLSDKNTPDQLRTTLTKEVSSGDKLCVQLEPISFTETRSYLAIINTVALAKGCQVKYENDQEYLDPPLDAVYTHEPNITTPT